ncbi:MAG TPA: penicillin-binding protein 2, partial [Bacteroidia bacterium]|nr:penicillin-binding protein 2 [Bacteroidia bacterium]
VAFAPRENPKIAIAVMVENSGFGATWAAPVASLMMEKYLTDSISRPELYERMIKGNLLPTRQDSIFKKSDKPVVPEIVTEVITKAHKP